MKTVSKLRALKINKTVCIKCPKQAIFLTDVLEEPICWDCAYKSREGKPSNNPYYVKKTFKTFIVTK
jgi:hypothetical protein